MVYNYNDSAFHRLGFRSDEIERTRLNDIQHALEILSKVEESCMDFDTRTSEVYAALTTYAPDLSADRAGITTQALGYPGFIIYPSLRIRSIV